MTISTAPVCTPADPYLLNTEQAGKFLAVSPETLRTWRCLGRGPAFVSISSRSVRYRVEDLKAWADAHLVGGAK